MATTKRESTLGKEKRCTSLSNSSITHAQRRPFQPSIEKQVPNYLKPTVSSRNDAIKNSKKTGPENPSQRPNLLRRRSFDGPPSAAPSQKALLSPGRDKSMSRSAASRSKTAPTPAKSTLERVSRKPNAGKPENISSSPRSLKKTSSPTTKKGRTLVSKKRPCSHEKKEAQNLETKHGKEEIVDHQVEEVMKNDQGEMDDFQMPKAEESEHLDVEDGKDALADISTVWHEHNVPDQTEKMKDKFHEEKSDHAQHDEDKENHRKDQETNVDHDLQEKIPHEDAKTETEDGGEGEGEKEDCANDQVTATKEIVEEKQLESSQEDGEGSQQGLESSKEKIVEGEDEKSEPEATNVVAKSQVQAGHGKKESPTPYNDVIEETASRLREERKNKVRALVGAFETVIDKESSNAK
ncbi:hypothetical protein DITRI_Ditri10aG0143800 [Diplodiscus trichospermus]